MNSIKAIILGLTSVVMALAFTGCGGGHQCYDHQHGRYAIVGPTTKQWVSFRGTVVHSKHRDGHYIVVSDAGYHYQPMNLGDRYLKSGLRVYVKGYAYSVPDRRMRDLDVREIRVLQVR